MIYAIVQMRVDNPDKLAAYRETANVALSKHSGVVVAVSAKPPALEGEAPAPDMLGVLSFPDEAAARAWVNDAEHADIHALRGEIGACDIKLLV